MNTLDKPNTRPIPPLPGGGSYTFSDDQWAWISNDPVPAEAPAEASQAAAGNQQAAASVAVQE